ncbi:amidase [Aidingimonas halophila]|uniref:Asp-tRNAAsn/Glu-tRNAGln amidotransferase A subunit n=1 Tax=Aidingimonas halophila TaxID=574349 RepID=A0A1H3CP35_9GAMM|nr:amidase [Aidingimonas halophila]GHC35129.1 amidase [Aidingimonas halophila]SDX55876.1 Asp-tRNAAsn/Glu-tRNAGln amidotransferase A subunit [Aidingimonas halophila]
MTDWNHMTLAGFQRALNNEELAPLDWWRACRKRIDALDPTLQAWEYLAPEPAITARNDEPPGPPLFGVPVGIKDIIDTVRLPTSWGTRGYHRVDGTDMDAAIVTLLTRLGALPMGKTVSTEYAYFQPSKTRNPHDPTRTPGGSSSGSAAAVAAGMVPVALGTQTVGSIIRPASYCGVVGFKPTHGTLSVAGLKALAPSLDTLGWFTRHLGDTRTLFTALTGSEPVAARERLDGVRVGLCQVPSTPTPSPEAVTALQDAADRMTALGAQLSPIDMGASFDELVTHQQVILAYEAARALASDRHRFEASMSPALIALLDEGQAIPLTRYWRSRQAADRARLVLSQYLTDRCDVLLAPSAPGVAPQSLETTGDPVYSRVWTLMGAPCVNLPLYWTPQGLPVGVQLIADRYQDPRLLSIASALMA